MSTPALVLLPELHSLPRSQVGRLGTQLGKLQVQGVPFPQTITLSREILLSVARANNLFVKADRAAKKSAKSTAFLSSLRSLIAKQHWPTDLAHELARSYHGYCKHGYVNVLASSLTVRSLSAHQHNVKGEANLLEAILEVWADAVLEAPPKSAHTLHPDTLIPAAILIQRRPNAHAAGVGYTRHPLTGDKSILYIQSVWGNVQSKLAIAEGDSYEVDARTYITRRKHVRQKPTRAELQLAGFELKPLAKKTAAAASLTPAQVERVAKLLHQIKQKSLHHFAVSWCLDGETLYCLNAEEMESSTVLPTQQVRTLTKILASVSTPQALTDELVSSIDGVGLFKPEYTFAQFGIHPQAALQTKYHRLLRKELSDAIAKTRSRLGNLPLVYRLQNFTSAELRELDGGDRFEPEDQNPLLGFRGGLRALLEPAVLEMELEVLQELSAKDRIELLIPFTRTPTELVRVLQRAEAAGISCRDGGGVWFELDTPENVFHLATYPLEQLSGVYLNAQSVSCLMAGIDPANHNVANYYQNSLSTLELLLRHTTAGISQAIHAKNLQKKPVLRILLENYSQAAVELAVRYGAEAVVVKPKVVALAHASITEAESSVQESTQ